MDVYPCLTYRDLEAALAFLERAFGLEPEVLGSDEHGAGPATAGSCTRCSRTGRKGSSGCCRASAPTRWRCGATRWRSVTSGRRTTLLSRRTAAAHAGLPVLRQRPGRPLRPSRHLRPAGGGTEPAKPGGRRPSRPARRAADDRLLRARHEQLALLGAGAAPLAADAARRPARGVHAAAMAAANSIVHRKQCSSLRSLRTAVPASISSTSPARWLEG
jgi:hypothetical protein